VILQAALNGSLAKDAHPRLPRSAAEIGWDARDVAQAGASCVHVHPREPRRESMGPTAVARTVSAIRDAAPGLPVGVITGERVLTSVRERVLAIEAWDVLPDFASVNWHDEGATDVASALLDRGIAVEAGLHSVRAARQWTTSPLRDECLRVLVRLHSWAPLSLADEIIDEAGEFSMLLHGEGDNAWPALRYALELGLDIRIGLEDTLEMPDGSPAASNAALVEAALALV
jgi:uncharacterized protein (DUF849 family)